MHGVVSILMLFTCVLSRNHDQMKKEMILTLRYIFAICILIWNNTYGWNAFIGLYNSTFIEGRRPTAWNRFPSHHSHFLQHISIYIKRRNNKRINGHNFSLRHEIITPFALQQSCKMHNSQLSDRRFRYR